MLFLAHRENVSTLWNGIPQQPGRLRARHSRYALGLAGALRDVDRCRTLNALPQQRKRHSGKALEEKPCLTYVKQGRVFATGQDRRDRTLA
jgi:hypothetical protein